MSGSDDKVTVENINTPGKTSRVNAGKYTAMKEAMLRVLPREAPVFDILKGTHLAEL